jgi:hypothetical protein
MMRQFDAVAVAVAVAVCVFACTCAGMRKYLYAIKIHVYISAVDSSIPASGRSSRARVRVWELRQYVMEISEKHSSPPSGTGATIETSGFGKYAFILPSSSAPSWKNLGSWKIPRRNLRILGIGIKHTP